MNVRYIFNKNSSFGVLQEYVRSEIRKCKIQDFVNKKLKGVVVSDKKNPVDLAVAFSSDKKDHTVTFNLKTLKGSNLKTTCTSPNLYEAVDSAATKLVKSVKELR